MRARGRRRARAPLARARQGRAEGEPPRGVHEEFLPAWTGTGAAARSERAAAAQEEAAAAEEARDEGSSDAKGKEDDEDDDNAAANDGKLADANEEANEDEGEEDEDEDEDEVDVDDPLAGLDVLLRRLTFLVGPPAPKPLREFLESRADGQDAEWGAQEGDFLQRGPELVGSLAAPQITSPQMPRAPAQAFRESVSSSEPTSDETPRLRVTSLTVTPLTQGAAASKNADSALQGPGQTHGSGPGLDRADEIMLEASRLFEKRQRNVERSDVEMAKRRRLGGQTRPETSRRVTWTPEERQLIVRAEQEYGRPLRLRVSSLLGIPQSTSDKIMARVRLRGPKDALVDSRTVRENKIGRGAKFDAKEAQWLLCRWLHEDATMTLSSLLLRLNQELFRLLVIRHHGAESLSAEEREIDGPLDAERWFGIDAIREDYAKHQIKSVQSVQNLLTLLVFSHRPSLREEIADAPIEVLVKWRTARLLNEILSLPPSSSSAHVVFLDQMPFLQRLTEKDRLERGELPCEQRSAVLRQGRKIALCTQIALAVSPVLGVIDAQTYAPDVATASARHAAAIATAGTDAYLKDTLAAPFALFARKRNGAHHPAAALGWTLEPFATFISGVLELLAQRLESGTFAWRRESLQHEGGSGQQTRDPFLLLVVNNVHGDWADPSIIQALPGYERLRRATRHASANGSGSVHLLGLRPSAPELNFCEHFYPHFRDAANDRARAILTTHRPRDLFKGELADEPAVAHRLEGLLNHVLVRDLPDEKAVRAESELYKRIVRERADGGHA
ncbi:Hypothetical Protein FCC1311_098982 [Hondaea fermentalgiana]|uniref:Uncharacterized protein n=1 Tax=Hondaea fermentalgiana TaxID=2315210 RepID=A0A2R5GSV8_9STRA|nr:Hypothetical Protein FCC1311_098982 [Hondaea fermentalgiana]|eukprot:GBG33675.1 Hypothetical Protein FCC1311_098982 [Hondaea fermentalgiana]